MPKIAFTPFALKAIKPPAPGAAGERSRVDYYDTTTPGFYVRVSSTGRRTWMYFAHVMRDGKRSGQRFTLGDAGPAGLTLAEARAKFKEARDVIDRGEDPKTVAAPEKKWTFAEIAKRYVEEYAKPETRTWKETERIIDRHLVSRWGATKMREITRQDVSEMLAEVKAGAKKGRGGVTTARHALSKARAVFNWYTALDEKFVSPIILQHGKNIGDVKEIDRTLSDSEIARVWACLTAPSINPVFRDCVRLLFLTAQRRGEVFKMRWSHLTPDNHGGAIWTIPGDVYKNKKEHTVFLTPAAYAIFNGRARIEGCDYVFTTDGRNPFSGYSKSKKQLDSLLAAQSGPSFAPWTLHDIRRTCRTRMYDFGISPDIAERVLGHLMPKLKKIYDHSLYAEPKRDAMAKIAAGFAAILAENGPR